MSKLHDSEHVPELQDILDQLRGVVYQMVGTDSPTFLYASLNVELLTGYSKADILDSPISLRQLLHPDDLTYFLSTYQNLTSVDQLYELEYRIITATGEVKWVWDMGRVTRRSDDDAFLFEGFLSDVTDRKRLDTELSEAREFSDAVIATAVEAIITIDAQGIVENFNHTAEAMFGYGAAEICGQNVRELMPKSYSDNHDHYIESYLRTGKASIIGRGREVSALRKDGSIFPMHLSVSEIHVGGRRAFVGLIRDLSMQRQAETEAQEHREQLAHVDRLSMLGEMASGIAHEINQPLTAISLFSQAGKRLLEKGQLSRIPEILEKLNQHSLRAGAVIDRMQMFARRGENVKETTDCNKLVSDVVEFAEAESRLRDIQIRVELAEELPSVMVDSVQIQQVTLNLLRNGMQAMQATSLDEAAPIVVRTRLSGDGEVEISVIDCGSGVAEEIVDELFKPFSTTKDSGMGMGLSICSEIVTSHGGQLDFRNNDDGGATFFFTLPTAALGI